MDLFKNCPTLESARFLLRPVAEEDCAALLEVYSDKNALPFFNSDNCHGDNFYYPTLERMLEALRFWQYSRENGWFVRWAVVDRAGDTIIGTVEVCRRASGPEDPFNGAGILRIDVKSGYETEDCLSAVGGLILPAVFEGLGCGIVITKAPIYAVERIQAVQRLGFAKSEHFLIGGDGYAYNGYWTVERREYADRAGG